MDRAELPFACGEWRRPLHTDLRRPCLSIREFAELAGRSSRENTLRFLSRCGRALRDPSVGLVETRVLFVPEVAREECEPAFEVSTDVSSCVAGGLVEEVREDSVEEV